MNIETIASTVSVWAEKIYFVNRIWLFGSRVNNTHKPSSDLDIAFDINREGTDPNPWTTWIFNAPEFEEQLSSLIGLKVNAIFYSHKLNPKPAQWVDKSGILIYERHGQP